MRGYLAVSAALVDAPTHWRRTTFRRIASQVKVPNSGSNEPLLSLSSSGQVSGRAGLGGLGRQAPSEVTIRTYWRVRPGQLVINPMWLVGGSVGVSHVSGAVSPAYRVYQVDPGVEPGYIHHLLRSYPYMEQYRLLGRGDTTFDRSVGREDFEDLPIALPPLEEQRRIADFLDDQVALLNRASELRERQKPLLEEHRWNSLLADVASAGGSWTPIRRVLAFLADGPFGSAFTSDDYAEEGAFVVRLGNIGFAEYRSAAQAFIPHEVWARFPRCHVRPGDLLIAGLGDPKNHAGRACVAPDLGFALVKGKCFCARIDKKLASADYLALVLSSPLGAEIFSVETRGSTRGMINLEIVKSVSIPLPSLEMQAQIVRAALQRETEVAKTRALVDRHINLLAERKQALITAAVTGQFDVTAARAVA